MVNIFMQTFIVAALCGIISANFYKIGSYGVGQPYEKIYFVADEIAVN